MFPFTAIQTLPEEEEEEGKRLPLLSIYSVYLLLIINSERNFFRNIKTICVEPKIELDAGRINYHKVRECHDALKYIKIK